MEIKKEVKSFLVEYQCDKCGNGTMKWNGETLLSYPAQYPHVCSGTTCSNMQNFQMTYPTIRYEEVNAIQTTATVAGG